jgi:hypothetical protein
MLSSDHVEPPPSPGGSPTSHFDESFGRPHFVETTPAISGILFSAANKGKPIHWTLSVFLSIAEAAKKSMNETSQEGVNVDQSDIS